MVGLYSGSTSVDIHPRCGLMVKFKVKSVVVPIINIQLKRKTHETFKCHAA